MCACALIIRFCSYSIVCFFFSPIAFSQQELSPSDKLKKQTQDLLHAELSSTLKRRKPIVINEPPKYEYPTYDDSNSNNGGVGGSGHNNQKFNDSSHSASVNISTPKPLNVNAVLSVVTGIKLPDIQYDANAVGSSSSSVAADKRKISHAKPNFIINHQKENNKPIGGGVHQSTTSSSSSSSPSSSPSSPPLLPKAPSPKMHNNGAATIDTPINNQPKLQRPSFFTNHSIGVDKTIVKTTPMAKPAIETNGAESQVEKCKSIFMIKSQHSQDDSAKPKLKLDATAMKFPSHTVIESSSPLKSIEVLNNKKNSINESSGSPTTVPLPNGSIPFASVANKKALFEKSAQGDSQPSKPYGTLRGAQTEKLFFNKPSAPSSLSPPSPPSMSNGKIHSPLNGHQNGRSKAAITTVTLNKNAPYGTNGQQHHRPNHEASTAAAKDAVDHFERSVHETATSKTTTTMTTMKKTTTANKYETKQQFEQKTIVSFSKDLLNAPNNYPEQIRVKKPITNGQRTPTAAPIADTPFHNIRFSIKTNGQVIPKAK